MKNDSGIIHLLVIITIAVVLILVGGVMLLDPKRGNSSNPLSKIIQKTVENTEKSTKNVLIDEYPRECKKLMGFDNYRTFRSLAIDPSDSQILYLAVEYKGVYKSTDGGKTWNEKNGGLRGYPSKDNPKIPCQEQHPSILVDITNPKRLIMTSASSPGKLTDMNSKNGGVYESLDGAENWHQLFKDDMNAWTYEALSIDPINPQTIYVGTTSMPASYDEADPNTIFVTKGIMYKTTDGGKNWSELPTGFVKYLRSGRIFLDPSNNRHIIFTTFALPPNRGGGQIQKEQMGILESFDGGESWKQMSSLSTEQKAITDSDISPKNFQNIFIMTSPSTERQFRYYSNDGGKTFTKSDTQINVFAFDPHDEKGLRLLGLNFYSPHTLSESLDGGKTWHSYSNLPQGFTNDARPSNIIWDPNNKNTIYIHGDEARVLKSEDNGKTWKLILSLEMLK